MTAADLPFADSLRGLAGWNQTLRDWHRLLEYEPAGCFLAEWNGTPAGTATTTGYGPELTWIGMVLVHPDFRRRGIGRALLTHCLSELDQRGIRCIKLDATPAGSELYGQLGFQTEWTLARWARNGFQRDAEPFPETVHLVQLNDVSRVAQLDAEAFGVSRQKFLASLMTGSRQARLHISASGEVDGYGLLREGSRADNLGPIVANSASSGVALVKSLISFAGEKIFWDIPDSNRPAVDLAKQLGFEPQRILRRMFRGENLAPGNPQRQFAIADPSVG